MPIIESHHRVHGVCACCGDTTEVANGMVSLANGDEAIYVVRWTQNNRSHNVAFLISFNGLNHFASVLYSFQHVSFMVVGPDGYDWGLDGDSRIMPRDEIVNTQWADPVYAFLDEIWNCDPVVNKLMKPEEN